MYRFYQKKVVTWTVLALLVVGGVLGYLLWPKSQVLKVKFYNQEGKVVKEFKVDKNTKLLDKDTNKQDFESLSNKFRWCLESDKNKQVDSNRVKDFQPLYEKVTQSLNLYPLVLPYDKKLVTFNFKKGNKVNVFVVDKGADSADVKTKVDQLEKPANDNFNFCGWFRFGYGGESF